MIPGLISGAPSLAGSSAATATGGSIGAFNLSPKAGVNPWLIGGVVIVVAFLLLRK